MRSYITVNAEIIKAYGFNRSYGPERMHGWGSDLFKMSKEGTNGFLYG